MTGTILLTASTACYDAFLGLDLAMSFVPVGIESAQVSRGLASEIHCNRYDKRLYRESCLEKVNLIVMCFLQICSSG